MASGSIPATTKVLYTAGIELYTGEAALTFLAQDTSAVNWNKLYKSCPWATVFQSHAFVATWYQTYHQKYLPIIVISAIAGRLTGLLALAYDHQKMIIGAGGSEAEYQGFLAEASTGENFITAALHKVRERFPHCSIRLKFLSAQVPLQWITDPFWKKRSVLQTSNCPLLEINSSAADKMGHKTGFRSKLNKLKRLGLVEFEHIKSSSQFSKVLSELVALYDFRQGARFNLNQFKNDPAKKDFYLALFKQRLLHVTILKVQGRIFAAAIAYGRQHTLHLSGLIVHAPFYAKYCSPGFLHLVLLTQQLAREGISVFDLSPGGDFYKSRMATKQVHVYELVITDHIGYRFKRHARKLVHHLLLKAGYGPMGVELAFKKRLYFLKAQWRQLKNKLLPAKTSKLFSFMYPTQQLVFELQPQHFLANNNATFPIHKDDLQDLLCYEEGDHSKCRWAFLEASMHRFEKGQSSFTLCQDGLLLACIWLDVRIDRMPLGLAIGDKSKPSYVIESFYCHPMGQLHWPEFVAAVVAKISAAASFAPVRAMASSNDQTLCRILEGIGFQKSTCSVNALTFLLALITTADYPLCFI